MALNHSEQEDLWIEFSKGKGKCPMQLTTPHGVYALDEDRKDRTQCHYTFHPPPAEFDHVEELRDDLTDLSAKVELLQMQLEAKSKIDDGARKANNKPVRPAKGVMQAKSAKAAHFVSANSEPMHHRLY